MVKIGSILFQTHRVVPGSLWSLSYTFQELIHDQTASLSSCSIIVGMELPPPVITGLIDKHPEQHVEIPPQVIKTPPETPHRT